MSDDRLFERNARAWLERGPADAPDRVVEAALLAIQKTSQERDLWIPWRLPTMNQVTRLATVVVSAIAVVGALFVLRGQGSSVGLPTATPSIEGTWETTFTRAEMQLAGLADPAEDDGSNYGHFVLSIHGGQVLTVQLSVPKSSSAGTYVITGNTFTATTNGETFSWTFTVTRTTLTFAGDAPVTLRVRPWTRIGP